ncbi:hypothetical protein [Streptomyces zagrosensis]|uniref:Uncharacterized protein n=1 Tax=Streptomyces zagrosensis TaxID=1042984 RepID=A0A7W9QBM5_9ACTN|nr:hypothetical protein [Streptomyces zagrosensis]MBB5937146.1 hypothetical protein [Streptomyces zagrosensis]
MAWVTEEFGASHEGRAQALLADGSEPKPVYFDVGSGGYVPSLDTWSVYDGMYGRPLAKHVQGSCSCGWRGERRYLLDWSEDEDGERYAAEEEPGPRVDWQEHVHQVEAASVPLPEDVRHLLEQVAKRLSALADDAPLAAVKAVAALERTADHLAKEAAFNTMADELPWEDIATGLGLTEQDARSRLMDYGRR